MDSWLCYENTLVNLELTDVCLERSLFIGYVTHCKCLHIVYPAHGYVHVLWILWTKLIADRWDWMVDGCKPKVAKWDTYKPKLLSVTGKVAVWFITSEWKLLKFLHTFWYWINVVGCREDWMREVIMVCSFWAAVEQGLVLVWGLTHRKKEEDCSPAIETIYQLRYFSCPLHV